MLLRGTVWDVTDPLLDRIETLAGLGVPRSELVEHVPAVLRDGVLHFSPEHLGPADGDLRPDEELEYVDLSLDSPAGVVCGCVLARDSFWVGVSQGDVILGALSLAASPVEGADPVQWWSSYEEARSCLREVYASPLLRSGPWTPASVTVLKRLVQDRLVPLQERLRSESSRSLLLSRLGLGPGPLVAALVKTPVLEDVAVLGSPLEDLVVAAAAHAVQYNQHGGVLALPEGLFARLEVELPGIFAAWAFVGPPPLPSTWEVFSTLWADAGSTVDGFAPALEAARTLSA